MSGTVLVVEGETPLGRALVHAFRQERWRVVTTHRKTERSDSAADGPDVLRIPWGKASSVSARNVLLKTLTAHQRLDLAVFPFSPALKRVLLHEAEYSEMEQAVDEWVLGTLFLLREVLGQLVRQGKGLLALVQGHVAGAMGVHPPLEALVRGGLTGLGHSLLLSYGGGEVGVCRFETESASLDGYAQFVTRKLFGATSRDHGRTWRFRERPTLLDRVRSLGVRGRKARLREPESP